MKVSSPRNSLRLLVDECCPRRIIDALRDAGHDVRAIVETNRHAPDEVVAEIALEDGRLLVSEDFGFGELAVRDRVGVAGVVLLDFGDAPLAERLARTLSVIGELGDRLAGHLTVIDLKRHRQRLLVD